MANANIENGLKRSSKDAVAEALRIANETDIYYVWACYNPNTNERGYDCSGFVSHCFGFSQTTEGIWETKALSKYNFKYYTNETCPEIYKSRGGVLIGNRNVSEGTGHVEMISGKRNGQIYRVGAHQTPAGHQMGNGQIAGSNHMSEADSISQETMDWSNTKRWALVAVPPDGGWGGVFIAKAVLNQHNGKVET